MVNHEGVVNRLLWAQQIRPMDVSDRMLQKTPSSFDVSVPEFFWPFVVGATLVMAEPDGHKDPGYLADVIVEHSVTRVHFVPSMLDVFLAEPKAALCSSLEIVNCSGEALPVHVARKVSEILPNTRVDNLFGPTRGRRRRQLAAVGAGNSGRRRQRPDRLTCRQHRPVGSRSLPAERPGRCHR